MDGLIFWMKKNQLLAGAIALIIVSVGYSQFFLGPRNYEDCILMVVKEAQTESSATYGKRACRAKFPLPRPPKGLSPVPPLPKGFVPVN